MHLLRTVGAAGISCLLVFSANAGEILDRAQTAERLIGEGQTVEALAEMEAAFNAAWAAAPLGFSEALFVAREPEGFGIYAARSNNVFRKDEQMLVYAEPFGYGYGNVGGLFTIDLSADFELRTPSGQVLHTQDDFARLSMQSQRRNKEFQVFITFSFDGLRAGDYVLVTRLNDENSEKAGAFELPFTIVD
jgi:hypothetical protein